MHGKLLKNCVSRLQLGVRFTVRLGPDMPPLGSLVSGLRARLTGRYGSRRYYTDHTNPKSPQNQLSCNVTLGFPLGYTVGEGPILSVLVNNLTNEISDEKYYGKRGYNLPGSNVVSHYTRTF